MAGIWVTNSSRSYLHGKAQTSDNDAAGGCTLFLVLFNVIGHASKKMVAFKLFTERKIFISRHSTRSFNIVKLCELQCGKLKQTRPTVFTLQY